MPPKKNTKSSHETVIESSSNSEGNMASASMNLEEFFDRRMKQQSEYINDLFIKYTKVTKSDLDEVKKSQNFLNDKFESLMTSMKEIKAEGDLLRSENARLQQRVGYLEEKVTESESDMENIKQYLRRDMLEIHGIPVTTDECTNSLVIKVVSLIDPDLVLTKEDISTSHRLHAARGYIPPIIVKFIRRDIRNRIYGQKRNLGSKTTSDLGFQQQSRLYINESLTQKGRVLLKTVKEFKKNNHLKFIWTRQGKVFLRKSEMASSQVFSFSTLDEFQAFKDDQNRRER